MAHAPEENVSLRLKNISLMLKPFTLELDVELRGRITALFGPSGSGKTSLLEIVAGLRRPQTALIQLGERVLTDTSQGISVPPRERGIGYVPQDLALFPHMTVRRNLLYGHRPGFEKQFRLDSIVQLLEIELLLHRGIGELSGGEKQRLALARALLSAPRLLLLDEPLVSLDLALKSKILPYLTRIRDECRIPMLYVTHDRFETLSLADEMVVLSHGKVAQTGSVQEIFGRPANLEVASMVAIETVQPGKIVKTTDGLMEVLITNTTVVASEQYISPSQKEVHVCIRAEDVVLFTDAAAIGSPRNRLPAVVRTVTPAGSLIRVDLDCGFPLVALLTKPATEELALAPGSKAVALVKAQHVHLIPRTG
jgi:molybdate transport system ATP-binding protein